MFLNVTRGGFSDFLAEKKSKMTDLTKESEAGIQSILNQAAGLEIINQELDDAISEVEKYIRSLSDVKNSMIQLCDCNKAIIQDLYHALNLEDGE